MRLHAEKLNETPAQEIVNLKKLLLLPRRPSIFVNREKELERICTALRSFQVVQIRGLGGIGKSELAIEAAYRVKESFPDGVMWLFMPENTTDDILNALATAFEISVGQMPVEAKKIVIQKALSGNKALLVLDNVDDIKITREILDIVAACAVLITNRPHIKISSTVLINLNPLPRESAVELFELISGDELSEIEVELADDICERLGSFPLAIELAAKQVQIAHIDLKILLEQVEKTTFDAIEAKFINDRSVRASFFSTYQILAESDKELFSMLGVFSGRSFSLEAVQAISRKSDVETTLYRLIALSLVKGEDNRYSLHPLLKAFALEQLSSSGVYKQMAEYFAEYAKANSRNYVALEIERINILGALNWSFENNENKLVVELMEALVGRDSYHSFLAHHADWDGVIRLLEKAIKSSQCLSDDQRTARFNSSLGLFYYWLGNHDKARENHKVAQELFEKIGDTRGLVRAHWQLGYIEDDEDNYDIAEELYRNSLEMSIKFGHKDLTYTSRKLVGIAKYHRGHYEAAKRYIEQSLEEARANDDQAAISSTQRRLASVIRVQASLTSDKRRKLLLLEESRRLLSDCLRTEKFDRTIARILRQFGLLEQVAGNILDARKYFERSLEMFQKLNHKKGVATALYNLGTVLTQQNEIDNAEKLCLESLTLGRELNIHLGVALNLRQLGIIADERGNQQKAIEYLTEAANIFDQIKSPYLQATREKLEKIRSGQSRSNKNMWFHR